MGGVGKLPWLNPDPDGAPAQLDFVIQWGSASDASFVQPHIVAAACIVPPILRISLQLRGSAVSSEQFAILQGRIVAVPQP
jgi:hypothetical protein